MLWFWVLCKDILGGWVDAAAWISSRSLDFISHAGLHLAGWTSTRRLDFISQPGLHPDYSALPVLPWAGRAGGSDMGRVGGPALHQNHREIRPFSRERKTNQPKIIFRRWCTSSFAVGGSGRQVVHGSGGRAGFASKPSGNRAILEGTKENLSSKNHF